MNNNIRRRISETVVSGRYDDTRRRVPPLSVPLARTTKHTMVYALGRDFEARRARPRTPLIRANAS